MILYKGFIETRGKRAIEKFKGRTDFKTLDEVKQCSEYAGVLAEDVVLIDIDDMAQSELLMDIVEDMQLNCKVTLTKRGRHFLFKNTGIKKCETHAKLACGLVGDIKLGSRNSYQVLKLDGEERFVEWECDELDACPKWLHPVTFNGDFVNMRPGDGRNQALFNYILTLQSNDFSVEETIEVIRIINTYILTEPLSEQEIETILRPDAFKKPIFFKGQTFLFDKFATFIKNANHIIRVNGQLHIYRDGVYVDSATKIEAQMIQHLPTLSKAKRGEVMSYLHLIVEETSQFSDANLIAFRNGIYNLVTNELMPFSTDVVITNKIDFDFVPDAYSELVDKTLDKLSCHDRQVRDLLEEAVGYCLYRQNELGKAFILIGDQSNGKSTFLDMVKTMLGEPNISALDLSELSERFKTAELFGKLANIGDDIGDTFIPNAAMFRKLVTGDRVTVEKKGQDPFQFNNYSKFLFSANNIPRIKDKTGAVQRRLTIIPFDAKFSKDDPDYRPFIKYELRDPSCVEYLIQLGIAGLKRVLANKSFSTSERVVRELAEYEESNNPVLGFIRELADEIENEPNTRVFKRYNEYCLANNLQPMSNVEFGKQMRLNGYEILDKKIEGKKYRIFVRM